MIDRQYMAEHPEVDWSVFKKQQTVPPAVKAINEENQPADPSRQDSPLGGDRSQDNSGVFPHFLSGVLKGAQGIGRLLPNPMDDYYEMYERQGKKAPIPRPTDIDIDKSLGLKDPSGNLSANNIADTLGQFAIPLPPIFKGAEKGAPIAKEAMKKAIDYMNPGKEAEAFRSTLGSGTSAENISELSKRAQFAKGSAKQEALIPKEKLYAQEGKSNVYNVDSGSLPEGNMGRFSSMLNEGEEFSKSQMDALSKALKDYRKTGSVDSFLEKSEDIFNIPELTPKAADKIEDILSMPTKRDSAYFSNKKVSDPYYEDSTLDEAHNAYKKKATLENYDDLQSAIKKEMRKITDKDSPRYHQLELNVKNLDKDKENFMQTLPDEMKNLENEFRQKYRTYAENYEKPGKGKAETGASLTLRRLAEGRHEKVTDAQVVKLFANPTAADKKAILDMGEGAARNALYAALQRVPAGDAEGMAKTILDLKRTKGFDKIVTPEIENWANNMLSHSKKVGLLKNVLGNVGSSLGGAAAGSAVFGPLGGAIGAAAPLGYKGAKYIAERFKK